MPIEINTRTPVTATHKSLINNYYLRLGKGDSLERYMDGKWVECDYIDQDTIFILNRSNYARIVHSGLAKLLCNLRLKLIGSEYRV